MKEQAENAPTSSEPGTNAAPSRPPVETPPHSPAPDKEPWVIDTTGFGEDVPQNLTSETGVN